MVFKVKYLNQYITICIAILIFLICFYGIIVNYSPAPYWDSWNGQLEFLLNYYSVTFEDKIFFLFEQHNEHRYFFTRILFLIDNYLFNSAFYSLYAFNAIAPFLPLGVIFLLQKNLELSLRYNFTALSACVLFSLLQKENFYWEFQSQFFLAQYIPFLCYYFVIRFWSKSVTKNSIYIFVAAILSAITMANGLLFAIPLCLIFACYPGYRKYALISALIWVFLYILYFKILPYESIENHGSFRTDVLPNFERYIRYIFTYVGSPFGSNLALIMGVLYVILALTIFWKQALRKSPISAQTVLLLFILYYGITVAATGLGRVNFGVGQAMASRYLTPTLLAWLCLLLLFVLRSEGRALPKTLVKWAPPVLALLLLVQQVSSFSREYHRLTERELALMSLHLGAEDRPKVQAILFPSLEFVTHIYDQSKVAGLNFTKPWSDWGQIGEQVETLDAQCLGAVDKIIPLGTSLTHVQGWILESDADVTARDSLVLVSKGTVVGIGLRGLYRPDVANVYGEKAKFSGFHLYMKTSQSKNQLALQSTRISSKCSLPFSTKSND